MQWQSSLQFIVWNLVLTRTKVDHIFLQNNTYLLNKFEINCPTHKNTQGLKSKFLPWKHKTYEKLFWTKSVQTASILGEEKEIKNTINQNTDKRRKKKRLYIQSECHQNATNIKMCAWNQWINIFKSHSVFDKRKVRVLA